ncbi:MAG: tripartite tricarboxylate transporter substrate-binding protein [SAR324 cluster bacterium]|nr:tripartite tricarboxylate transporter substrate-binding protein [SAR324 cluster bacterium]MCZ6730359.1 tripartite tricarboxylate transporter substrate-binding protein [SAR324 cluster bacterium]
MGYKNNSLKLAARILVLAVGAVFLFSSMALAQWEPRKPIKFVVMAGKGGGAGKLSRLFQGIIEKNNFSSQPFVPDYKKGGSGAEALVYMKGKTGDSHTVLLTLNSYFTTPLRQPALNVDIATFTPIARMAMDTFVLWVHATTDIKNLDDFVRTVKSQGRKWNMGGTGRGQEDQLLTNILKSTFNLDMNYTPFKGGGTVAKNLAGMHINSTVNNPSEAIPFFESNDMSKKVRPLVAFTPNRLAVFPDVPTFSELGYSGLSYFMQRSVIGPPKMPAEAVAYYVKVFEKVHNSNQWKKHAAKKALFRDFLTGSKLQAFFMKERDKHRELLKSTGEL